MNSELRTNHANETTIVQHKQRLPIVGVVLIDDRSRHNSEFIIQNS
jgi:hypothetical protein